MGKALQFLAFGWCSCSKTAGAAVDLEPTTLMSRNCTTYDESLDVDKYSEAWQIAKDDSKDPLPVFPEILLQDSHTCSLDNIAEDGELCPTMLHASKYAELGLQPGFTPVEKKQKQQKKARRKKKSKTNGPTIENIDLNSREDTDQTNENAIDTKRDVVKEDFKDPKKRWIKIRPSMMTFLNKPSKDDTYLNSKSSKV